MPAAVTALVAVATATPDPDAARVDVEVTLFADLDDGRRVVVDGRGYGLVGHGFAPGHVPPVEEVDVRNCLLPDDDDDPEPLPWAWAVRQLAERGVTTTEAALRALPPYVVEIS
jgi:hypothetical protein